MKALLCCNVNCSSCISESLLDDAIGSKHIMLVSERTNEWILGRR